MVIGGVWAFKILMEPGWDKMFFLLSIDTITILLQTLLYYINYNEECDPNAKTIFKWKFFHLLVGYIPHPHGKKHKTDSKTFEEEPLVISNDSYGLAFAAMIHPE